MNRDWSIASQKASNAIVEGLAFDVIRRFYEVEGIKMNRIDYNSALDLTGKQKFDLIDGYGKKWEIKCDKIAVNTGRLFIERLEHADFDYLLIFSFFPFIFEFNTYCEIINDPSLEDAEG